MTSVLLHNNCATMIRLLSRSGEKAPATPVCDLFRAAINQLYLRRSPFSHSVSLSLPFSRRTTNHFAPHFSKRYHQLVAKRCTLQLKKETRNSRAHWLREQSCASLFATLWYQQKEGKGGGRSERVCWKYFRRLPFVISLAIDQIIVCSRRPVNHSPVRWENLLRSASKHVFYCFQIEFLGLFARLRPKYLFLRPAPHRPRKCLFHRLVCFHTFFSKSHRNNSEWFKVRALTSDVRRSGAQLFNHNWQVFCNSRLAIIKNRYFSPTPRVDVTRRFTRDAVGLFWSAAEKCSSCGSRIKSSII